MYRSRLDIVGWLMARARIARAASPSDRIRVTNVWSNSNDNVMLRGMVISRSDPKNDRRGRCADEFLNAIDVLTHVPIE